MYNIYIDKNELFEANIKLNGATLDETFARLVVSTDKWNLIFEGSIDERGNVKIPIKKLKNIFTEEVRGTLKLEVIADDTYFTPWEDSFELSRSRTVTAEVKQKNEKMITESAPVVTIKKKTKGHRFNNVNELSKSYLREIMIAEKNMSNGDDIKGIIRDITDNFIEKYDIQPHIAEKRDLYEMVRVWNLKKKRI